MADFYFLQIPPVLQIVLLIDSGKIQQIILAKNAIKLVLRVPIPQLLGV